MDTITRRKFLKLSGAAVVGASAAVLSIEDIAKAAQTQPLPPGTPIVVVVTLYGGNDGLNTVIPYTDSLYYSMRPEISYKPEKILPLSDGLGLNPGMTDLKTMWDQKKVAVIRGVGYPNPDHSHFASMAIWQTASPFSHISTGWLGRWLDTQKNDPMLAINLGSVPPPLFAGAKRSGSALPLGGLVVPTGKLAMRCQTLGRANPGENSLMAAAALSMGNLFNLSENVSSVLKNSVTTNSNLPVINGGSAGGDSSLEQQLDLVAKLIVSGAPTRAWSVSLGGFDTHANEANAQSTLLGNVSYSIRKFFNAINTSSRSSDVTMLVYSEFGRRVKANASQGTDHGTSGPVLVIGDRINGGMYGEQPQLNKLIDGDLAVTTDFRDIYASLLERDLSADPSQILNGWKGRISSLYK
ncbi:MAG: hypothetical protein RJB28_841 [Actinomycetota bacterium]|jgi:uncharacterized protein (DUF1501 family)|nr:DUF1501 domain-containing protein [Actinomycetota bacterium]